MASLPRLCSLVAVLLLAPTVDAGASPKSASADQAPVEKRATPAKPAPAAKSATPAKSAASTKRATPAAKSTPAKSDASTRPASPARSNQAPPADLRVSAKAPARSLVSMKQESSTKPTTSAVASKKEAPVQPASHKKGSASSSGTKSRPRTAKLEPPARRALPSQSIGSPTAGRLVGGAKLQESPHVRVVPFYAGDARWGLEPLVDLVDRAARMVRKQFPDAALSVGHLSKPGGGGIDRHASHESGRDADLGFYVVNHKGRPIYADHFVPFRGDGTAPTWPGARFDDARNWALVAAIVGYPRAKVTHIFVASPLRERLLRYAAKINAPLSIRKRAAELMAQPRGSMPHDDHFHVRIACPRGMTQCIERPVGRKPRPWAERAPEIASTHGAQSAGGAKKGASPSPSRPSTSPVKAQPAKAPPAGAPPAATTSPPAPLPPPPRLGSGRMPQKARPKAPPPPRSEDAESGSAEARVPSLAPIVPGLDSVVIPAPLAGLRPLPPPDAPASPEQDEGHAAEDTPPIEDPDGVLERP